MKKIIKHIGSRIIHKAGLFKLMSFNTKILAFHMVNPKYFEKQMEHLVKYYNVISLKEIFSNKKNSVVLTFDDGYENNLKYAYHVLKKLKIPATIFVPYDFIDKNIFAWWDRLEFSSKNANIEFLKSLTTQKLESEIRRLTNLTKNDKKPSKYDFIDWKWLNKISDVFEVGSHTISHPILTSITLKEAEKEILESKEKIEEKIGKKVIYFAYPNGNYNKSIVSVVKKAGYKFAVIYEKGKIKTNTNPLKLYRRGINVNDNLSVFVAKVAGAF